MTDVFISYAHEDQAFARMLAAGLEAEGLSVWWDHTIPPGKTWDTHIAAGIEAAKACVVVWSARSVDSDWVKEEAALARDADRFLSVALDQSLPPVGFRRIQAALMSGWQGDRSHQHFQLLVREVRALASGGRPVMAPIPAPAPSYAPAPPPPPAVEAAPPAPAYTPPAYAAAPAYTPPAYAAPAYAPAPTTAEAPRPSPPWGLIGGVAAGAALGLIAVFAFINQDAPSPAAPVEQTQAAQTSVAAETVAQSEEAARLIRERDEALKMAEDARVQTEQQEIAAALAETERAEQERQLAQQRAQSQQNNYQPAAGSGRGIDSYLGEWVLWRTDSGSGCPNDIRLRLQGRTLIWDYAPEGYWTENLSSSEYAITSSGRLEFQPPGGTYWGEVRNGRLTMNQMYNQCTYERVR